MKDKKTLSRQRIFMSRQTQHEVEVNSVATKTTIYAKEVEKNYKKLMLRHGKEFKEEVSITIQKFYVATENGRDLRPAKISLLQQTVQPVTKLKEENMPRHFQSLS